MKDFDLTTVRLFVAVFQPKSIKGDSRGVYDNTEGEIQPQKAKNWGGDAQKTSIHQTRSRSALTGPLTLATSSANGALSLSELVSQCHPHTMLASLCLRVLQTSAVNAACQHRIYLPRAILVT